MSQCPHAGKGGYEVELTPSLGNSCRSVALSSVVNYYGYHMSEAMCFGIGETLDYAGADIRFGWNKRYTCYSGNNENDIFRFVDNMGMNLEIFQPRDRKETLHVLSDHIEQGIPIIARVSINKYMRHLPMTATDNVDILKSIFRLISGAAGNHVTLVTNEGRDKVMIHEPNISDPILLPKKNLLAAMNPRNAVVRHPSNTFFVVKPRIPAREMEKEKRMIPVIWGAIGNNMRNYLFGAGHWSGVEQIEKSGKAFRDIRKPKAYEKSVILFRFFCDIATGGGFYRRLYGRFLKEANEAYLKDDLVDQVSKKYFSLSRKWSQLSKKMMDTITEKKEQKNGPDSLKEDWGAIASMEKELAYKLYKRSKEKANGR